MEEGVKIIGRKARRRRSQERSRRRWVCNIKMDLEKIEWGAVDWLDMA
jgi:hypothetical protein